jgi:hypothetical protein
MDAISAQGNLSEARPRPDAYNLDRKGAIPGRPIPAAHRPYDDGARRWRAKSDPVDSDRVGWVHSREHTRINSGERQGPRGLRAPVTLIRTLRSYVESTLLGLVDMQTFEPVVVEGDDPYGSDDPPVEFATTPQSL